jgi:hypothetical protein
MIAGIIVLQVAFVKCGIVRQELSPAEYVQWIESEDNGIRTSKTINGYTFDLQYKPAEYVVLRESSMELPTPASLNSEMQALSDMQYFTLRISKEGDEDLLEDDVSSPDEFSSRLVYFTGAMQNDIYLVESGDTLPCALFHFERTYSVDTRSTFLIGFLKTKVSTDTDGKTFVFEDRELGTGPIVLSIDQSNLDRIPSLTLD